MWWSNEYPLDLIQSLYAAKLRHETVLLLWFVASPWYWIAKCQPTSPCVNSKRKCSDSRCASLICSNSPTRWCKITSHSAPHYRPSKMAATSLRKGYQLQGLVNRTLRTSWFVINSPARRNISTNEFTIFSTLWIVTTISLSKPSVTTCNIFTCLSISLLKMYNGQVPLAPQYMLDLQPFSSINPWEWHLGAETCSSWYLIWSVLISILLYFN